MWEITVLISVKLKQSPKFKDIDICLEEGTVKLVDLIGKWAGKSEITAIIRFDGNAIQEDFTNTIDNQICLLRVIGKAVKRVQMYFKVQIYQIVKELVEKELIYCKENNLSVITKTTRLEHTRKVGFIIGVHLKIASVPWYKNQIEKQLDILDGLIEIKKEIVY